MKKHTKKDIIILFLLVILFLILRLTVLFTFTGVLGGEETFYLGNAIHSILKGDFDILELLLQNAPSPYKWFSFIMQIPFTLPFYLLFPTNEFSAFLGVLLSNLILLIMLFIFLKKQFNLQTAIFASLAFILSPLGYTIASVSSNMGGMNLSVFVLIPFLSFFLNKDKKKRQLSMFLLAILPLFTLYHLILWPTCFTYLILEKFLNKKRASTLKEIMEYFRNFSLAILILFPFYSMIFLFFTSDAENTIVSYKQNRYAQLYRDKIKFHLPDYKRISLYFNYFIQPFVGKGIINFNVLAYLSFAIYLILLFSAFSYATKEIFSNKKIKSYFLFFLYLLFYVMTELIFNKDIYDYLYKNFTIRTHYLQIFLFVSFIFISIFVYKHKRFKILFYIFLLLNLGITLSAISLNNNNFTNYNLGNNNYIRGQVFFNSTIERVSASLNSGNGARDRDILNKMSSEIDYKLYGYGMNYYYGNTMGINFCNRIPDKTDVLRCKEGYLLNESTLSQYLKTEYNLTKGVAIFRD